MENALYSKSCINDLQKALNNNSVDVLEFDNNFNRITISGISISKIGNYYVLNLIDTINNDFITKWRNTVCKLFVKDMKNSLFNLYKVVKYGNLYYLLRLIEDKKMNDFVDVNYVDNNYAIVTISNSLNFDKTYLPFFNLKEYFEKCDTLYECSTLIEENDEDNDELMSKTLFNEEDLTN